VEHWLLLLLANGAVMLGAAIQATVGFGMNLIALPLLMSLDDRYIPAPLLIAHLVLVVCLSSLEWKMVDRRVLGAALAGAVPGTLLGMLAISRMSRGLFVAFTAAVLIAGIVVTARKVRIPATTSTLALAGVLSGLCGTTTSVNGPPLAVLMVRSSSLASIRATLALFLLLSTIFSLAALYFAGRVDRETVALSAWLIPGTLAGLSLARLWKRHVGDPEAPQRMFLAASVLATAVFLIKEVWLLLR
jgi:uncharacterized membrane protein YfcA